VVRRATPIRLQLAVEEVAIDQLRPDPANPRRIGDAELDALERSMRHFGFVQPVLARRADGVVIGGHQRLTAARRLGQATVPVIWLDLSADDARLLGLALNKINGSWDEQLLARLLWWSVSPSLIIESKTAFCSGPSHRLATND
jgi:ParB-like chromosome segregation protein Spo0J